VARSDRTSRIAASVSRSAGMPGASATLSALPGSALGSLLLDVFRTRAERIAPADVHAAASRALHAPSAVDARTLHALDAAALEAASGFEAIDLAPVAPFGACAALSAIDQNNVLTTLRGAELLADPTVALALVAAACRRRAPRPREPVRLCASARLVRLQPIETPVFTPHFRLFALVTAGRDAGEHRFETEALREHVLAWLALFSRLRSEGFRIDGAEVQVSDAVAVEAICAAAGVDVAEVRATAAAHRVGTAAEALARRGVTPPAATSARSTRASRWRRRCASTASSRRCSRRSPWRTRRCRSGSTSRGSRGSATTPRSCCGSCSADLRARSR
jgi:hypothetical protein